jgi:hypothetical protein
MEHLWKDSDKETLYTRRETFSSVVFPTKNLRLIDLKMNLVVRGERLVASI